MSSSDLGKSRHGIPDAIFVHIDKYVDSLAPEVQPRIASELAVFQQKTIDSLEDQVLVAFRSLFKRDHDGGNEHLSRSLGDEAPDAYGAGKLSFANEIAGLSRSFSAFVDNEVGNDLREIFDLTEHHSGSDSGRSERQSRGLEEGDRNRGDSFSRSAKGFLSAAMDAVQDHMDKRQDINDGGKPKVELDGLLGVLSGTIKDAARNPEEKARVISPEIKERVAMKLREQHAPLAEKLTQIALDHIKRWLRGNTSSRDLGDGVKGEVEDQIKDLARGIKSLFGHKKQDGEGTARGLGDESRDRDAGSDGGSSGGHGFSRIISDKLSTGLARVHRDTRLEFRHILGNIEKQLFELLPDEVQGPLEKILGGNPFSEELDHSAAPNASRGFGDDIKAKLVEKVRKLVRKVQEALRESILAVVSGGHRKLERESWVFVQKTVEVKVQKYLPNVRITVPDDIGNEGVSVGEPQPPSGHVGVGSGQVGSGQGIYPPTTEHGTYAPPPSYPQPNPAQPYNNYSPTHSYQNYNPPPPQQQQYPTQSHTQDQGYRPEQYRQSYQPQQRYD